MQRSCIYTRGTTASSIRETTMPLAHEEQDGRSLSASPKKEEKEEEEAEEIFERKLILFISSTAQVIALGKRSISTKKKETESSLASSSSLSSSYFVLREAVGRAVSAGDDLCQVVRQLNEKVSSSASPAFHKNTAYRGQGVCTPEHGRQILPRQVLGCRTPVCEVKGTATEKTKKKTKEALIRDRKESLQNEKKKRILLAKKAAAAYLSMHEVSTHLVSIVEFHENQLKRGTKTPTSSPSSSLPSQENETCQLHISSLLAVRPLIEILLSTFSQILILCHAFHQLYRQRKKLHTHLSGSTSPSSIPSSSTPSSSSSSSSSPSSFLFFIFGGSLLPAVRFLSIHSLRESSGCLVEILRLLLLSFTFGWPLQLLAHCDQETSLSKLSKREAEEKEEKGQEEEESSFFLSQSLLVKCFLQPVPRAQGAIPCGVAIGISLHELLSLLIPLSLSSSSFATSSSFSRREYEAKESSQGGARIERQAILLALRCLYTVADVLDSSFFLLSTYDKKSLSSSSSSSSASSQGNKSLQDRKKDQKKGENERCHISIKEEEEEQEDEKEEDKRKLFSSSSPLEKDSVSLFLPRVRERESAFLSHCFWCMAILLHLYPGIASGLSRFLLSSSSLPCFFSWRKSDEGGKSRILAEAFLVLARWIEAVLGNASYFTTFFFSSSSSSPSPLTLSFLSSTSSSYSFSSESDILTSPSSSSSSSSSSSYLYGREKQYLEDLWMLGELKKGMHASKSSVYEDSRDGKDEVKESDEKNQKERETDSKGQEDVDKDKEEEEHLQEKKKERKETVFGFTLLQRLQEEQGRFFMREKIRRKKQKKEKNSLLELSLSPRSGDYPAHRQLREDVHMALYQTSKKIENLLQSSSSSLPLTDWQVRLGRLFLAGALLRRCRNLIVKVSSLSPSDRVSDFRAIFASVQLSVDVAVQALGDEKSFLRLKASEILLRPHLDMSMMKRKLSISIHESLRTPKDSLLSLMTTRFPSSVFMGSLASSSQAPDRLLSSLPSSSAPLADFQVISLLKRRFLSFLEDAACAAFSVGVCTAHRKITLRGNDNSSFSSSSSHASSSSFLSSLFRNPSKENRLKERRRSESGDVLSQGQKCPAEEDLYINPTERQNALQRSLSSVEGCLRIMAMGRLRQEGERDAKNLFSVLSIHLRDFYEYLSFFNTKEREPAGKEANRIAKANEQPVLFTTSDTQEREEEQEEKVPQRRPHCRREEREEEEDRRRVRHYSSRLFSCVCELPGLRGEGHEGGEDEEADDESESLLHLLLRQEFSLLQRRSYQADWLLPCNEILRSICQLGMFHPLTVMASMKHLGLYSGVILEQKKFNGRRDGDWGYSFDYGREEDGMRRNDGTAAYEVSVHSNRERQEGEETCRENALFLLPLSHLRILQEDVFATELTPQTSRWHDKKREREQTQKIINGRRRTDRREDPNEKEKKKLSSSDNGDESSHEHERNEEEYEEELVKSGKKTAKEEKKVKKRRRILSMTSCPGCEVYRRFQHSQRLCRCYSSCSSSSSSSSLCSSDLQENEEEEEADDLSLWRDEALEEQLIFPSLVGSGGNEALGRQVQSLIEALFAILPSSSRSDLFDLLLDRLLLSGVYTPSLHGKEDHDDQIFISTTSSLAPSSHSTHCQGSAKIETKEKASERGHASQEGGRKDACLLPRLRRKTERTHLSSPSSSLQREKHREQGGHRPVWMRRALASPMGFVGRGDWRERREEVQESEGIREEKSALLSSNSITPSSTCRDDREISSLFQLIQGGQQISSSLSTPLLNSFLLRTSLLFCVSAALKAALVRYAHQMGKIKTPSSSSSLSSSSSSPSLLPLRPIDGKNQDEDKPSYRHLRATEKTERRRDQEEKKEQEEDREEEEAFSPLFETCVYWYARASSSPSLRRKCEAGEEVRDTSATLSSSSTSLLRKVEEEEEEKKKKRREENANSSVVESFLFTQDQIERLLEILLDSRVWIAGDTEAEALAVVCAHEEEEEEDEGGGGHDDEEIEVEKEKTKEKDVSQRQEEEEKERDEKERGEARELSAVQGHIHARKERLRHEGKSEGQQQKEEEKKRKEKDDEGEEEEEGERIGEEDCGRPRHFSSGGSKTSRSGRNRASSLPSSSYSAFSLSLWSCYIQFYRVILLRCMGFAFSALRILGKERKDQRKEEEEEIDLVKRELPFVFFPLCRHLGSVHSPAVAASAYSALLSLHNALSIKQRNAFSHFVFSSASSSSSSSLFTSSSPIGCLLANHGDLLIDTLSFCIHHYHPRSSSSSFSAFSSLPSVYTPPSVSSLSVSSSVDPSFVRRGHPYESLSLVSSSPPSFSFYPSERLRFLIKGKSMTEADLGSLLTALVAFAPPSMLSSLSDLLGSLLQRQHEHRQRQLRRLLSNLGVSSFSFSSSLSLQPRFFKEEKKRRMGEREGEEDTTIMKAERERERRKMRYLSLLKEREEEEEEEEERYVPLWLLRVLAGLSFLLTKQITFDRIRKKDLRSRRRKRRAEDKSLFMENTYSIEHATEKGAKKVEEEEGEALKKGDRMKEGAQMKKDVNDVTTLEKRQERDGDEEEEEATEEEKRSPHGRVSRELTQQDSCIVLKKKLQQTFAHDRFDPPFAWMLDPEGLRKEKEKRHPLAAPGQHKRRKKEDQEKYRKANEEEKKKKKDMFGSAICEKDGKPLSHFLGQQARDTPGQDRNDRQEGEEEEDTISTESSDEDGEEACEDGGDMPLRYVDEDGDVGEEDDPIEEEEEDEEKEGEDEVKKNSELFDELIKIELENQSRGRSELETTQRLLTMWKEKISQEKEKERRRKEKKGKKQNRILRPRLGWAQLGKYGSLRLQATEILMRVRLLLHVDPRPAAGVYIHLTMLRCLYVLTTRKKELLPRIHEIWPSLLPSFSPSTPLPALVIALAIVRLMASSAGGFVRDRFSLDVFPPLLHRLQGYSQPSTLHDQERRSEQFKFEYACLSVLLVLSVPTPSFSSTFLLPLIGELTFCACFWLHKDAAPILVERATILLGRLNCIDPHVPLFITSNLLEISSLSLSANPPPSQKTPQPLPSPLLSGALLSSSHVHSSSASEASRTLSSTSSTLSSSSALSRNDVPLLLKSPLSSESEQGSFSVIDDSCERREGGMWPVVSRPAGMIETRGRYSFDQKTCSSSSSAFSKDCERLLRVVYLSTCTRNLISLDGWRRVACGVSFERFKRLKEEMERDQAWRFLHGLGLNTDDESEKEVKTEKEEEIEVYVHSSKREGDMRNDVQEEERRRMRGAKEEGEEKEEGKKDGDVAKEKKKKKEDDDEDKRRKEEEKRGDKIQELPRDPRVPQKMQEREHRRMRNLLAEGDRGKTTSCERLSSHQVHEKERQEKKNTWRSEWRRRKRLGWMYRPLQMIEYTGPLARAFLQWREDYLEEKNMRRWLDERREKSLSS
ncbi:hypothetical protein CSUI_004792 [Cystoisospora suis]|uniref:TTI1 C-terminal TPR domain-containing protein n=1 Tax=Cystoisospora suis TaxID=483139 RepID=A0A2C6K9V7_9APIC|nr:hypothetical protein CSUI_004792 [Cystoisospora suis]